MNRQQAIDLARRCALNSKDTHSYLPVTDADASVWMPHEWVIDALMAAPQVVPDGMVVVPIEPPIHAVARLPGSEAEARKTYSRVIASASGGLVAYSCRDECEGGKHSACGDWCGNQESCLAVFKAVISDSAPQPAAPQPAQG